MYKHHKIGIPNHGRLLTISQYLLNKLRYAKNTYRNYIIHRMHETCSKSKVNEFFELALSIRNPSHPVAEIPLTILFVRLFPTDYFTRIVARTFFIF